jgi:integrase
MATITKLESGKYRAQVRKSGEYRNHTFEKKSEALAWSREIERQIGERQTKGITTAHASITVADLVEGYLGAVEINKAAHATLRAVCRVIGQIKLQDLNSSHLQLWIEQRRKDGVTGATIGHNLGLISGVLKWARFTRHLDVDPNLARDARAGLSAARVKTTSVERDRYITDAEIALMRSTFEAQGKLKLPLADLMDFALATGMRLGEITRIEHGDLSHNERTILITNRKDPRRKEGNHQRVPLSSTAMAIIARQPTTTGRIFPYATNSVSIGWIVARDLAGLEDIRFHDLRHRAITQLFEKGLSIPEVSLLSGHKTWAMLRRYTQVQPGPLVSKLG